MTYAYLGPEGTFTQLALRRLQPAAGEVPSRAFPTVATALDSVRRGESVAAVVPLENSVKGVVPATMDQLVSAGLHINAEVEVPVTFALMAPPGTELRDVVRVSSHPHALAQCARWLSATLPDARTQAADSTAAAAQAVAEAEVPGDAAIAAVAAAELYGLRVLRAGIGESAGAVTRFVSVSREWVPPARTRLDRTSLVVSFGDSGPEPLVEVLNVFSSRGIALAWLQSWPTGDRLGSYRFFIDIDGHIDDPPVSEATRALAELGLGARFLGSYPRGTSARHRAEAVAERV